MARSRDYHFPIIACGWIELLDMSFVARDSSFFSVGAKEQPVRTYGTDY
jgi:hypothetical protein